MIARLLLNGSTLFDLSVFLAKKPGFLLFLRVVFHSLKDTFMLLEFLIAEALSLPVPSPIFSTSRGVYSVGEVMIFVRALSDCIELTI